MIDRVLSIDKNKITALKNVSHNEPHFQGHFTDHPIMPGALILEAMMQASAILGKYRMSNEKPKCVEGYLDKVSFVVMADKVRFRRAVRPGDQLILKVSTVPGINNTWKSTGTAKVDKTTVAEAEWVSMLVDKND